MNTNFLNGVSGLAEADAEMYQCTKYKILHLVCGKNGYLLISF